MREFIKKIKSAKEINDSVTLDLFQRVKCRIKAVTDSGESIGIFMKRGTVLKNDDLIQDKDGYIIKIIAASEKLSSIYSKDYLQLLKACYHLGNRHVELQITKESLHYKHDHVLDNMIKSLGFEVIVETLPFQPESGAYYDHTEGKHHHEHK